MSSLEIVKTFGAEQSYELSNAVLDALAQTPALQFRK